MSLKQLKYFQFCATPDVPPQTALNACVCVCVYPQCYEGLLYFFDGLYAYFWFCNIYQAYITSKFQHIIICNNWLSVFNTKYIGKFIHYLHTKFYIPQHKQLNVMTLYMCSCLNYPDKNK